jgi:sigma-B regulation protein RsbU (phosphoserine phosphatase)
MFVVDVSGHGVASSLLSVTIGRVLTPQVSSSSLLVKPVEGSSETRIVPPAEVAFELNRRFPMEDQGGLYFTMVYGVLDLETMAFRFGRPSPRIAST